jgi:hypothetical protein
MDSSTGAGLFFGLPPRSQRARHVRARPSVSANRTDGELGSGGHCLIVHGTAQEVAFGHPLYEGYSRYALGAYGIPVPDLSVDPDEGRQPPDYTGYIEPRRIYVQGF